MTEQSSAGEQPRPAALTGATEDGRTYVVTPTAMAVQDNDADAASPTDMVSEPAKVMRIGTMVRQLLEEVRSAPLDEPGRHRLAQLQAASIEELKDGLSPELAEELERLTMPFNTDSAPTDAELRISQAQLVGWLEGLFQGIQTALVAQQMAARAQLDQMRRALPGAGETPGGAPGAAGGPGPGHSGGMYL